MAEDSKTIDFFDDDAAEQADRIYRASVDECARERRDRFLSNRTTGHARYILERIFEYAESEVRLWTNGMPREENGEPMYASADLIDAAMVFLGKPNTRLSIVVNGHIDVDEGQSLYDHPFLGAVLRHEHADSQVRVVHVHNPDDADHVLDVRGFVVMDESGYRAEIDDGSRAVVNFGDREVAGSLVATFETVAGYAK